MQLIELTNSFYDRLILFEISIINVCSLQLVALHTGQAQNKMKRRDSYPFPYNFINAVKLMHIYGSELLVVCHNFDDTVYAFDLWSFILTFAEEEVGESLKS